MVLPLLSLFKLHPEKKRLARHRNQEDTYSFQNASVLMMNLDILCPYKISRSFLNFMLSASKIAYDKQFGRKTLSRKNYSFQTACTFCRVFPIAHFHNTFRCIIHITRCFTYQVFCQPFINMFNTEKDRVAPPYCREDQEYVNTV